MNRIILNQLIGKVKNISNGSKGFSHLAHSKQSQLQLTEINRILGILVNESNCFNPSSPTIPSSGSRLSYIIENDDSNSLVHSYRSTSGRDGRPKIDGDIMRRFNESCLSVSSPVNSFIDLPTSLPLSKAPMVDKTKTVMLEMPTKCQLVTELIAPSVAVTINPETSCPDRSSGKANQMKCISKRDKYESIPPFNYRNTIMHIRERKIKKHHRLKWRKNNLAAIKYTRLRRNILKEKLFRAEIFAAVREAENFDAEKYVDEVLKAIDTAPKPEPKEEALRKTLALMRKYRSETDLITPEFDDEVKPIHPNAFKIK